MFVGNVNSIFDVVFHSALCVSCLIICKIAMPKGRWITDRMVEKSSTSADVKFNTCSPRSVSRNAVPLFDDSLVISPAAHRWPIRVRILPWLIPISSASPSTLPVALLRLVVFIVRCALCDNNVLH